jgi:hypothetical protein
VKINEDTLVQSIAQDASSIPGPSTESELLLNIQQVPHAPAWPDQHVENFVMPDDLTPQEQLDALKPEHREQVERVYSGIKDALIQKHEDKLKFALEVGGFIYDGFYNGEQRLYETRGQGTPSLEALHARILLELGEGVIKIRTLRYYVTTAIQARKWEGWIARQMMDPCVREVGFTHRTILVTCQGARDEIRIAEETAREGLSVSAVRERVTAANSREGGGGARERLSGHARAAIGVRRALLQLVEHQWSTLDDAELCWLHDMLKDLCSELAGYIEEGESERRKRFDGRLSPAEHDASAGNVDEILADVLLDYLPETVTRIEAVAAEHRAALADMENPEHLIAALSHVLGTAGVGLRRLPELPPVDEHGEQVLVNNVEQVVEAAVATPALQKAITKMVKRTGAPRGSKKGLLYVIAVQKPWADEVHVAELADQPQPEAVCIVAAPDKDAAVEQYLDMMDDDRSIFAVYLKDWAKGTGMQVDLRTYLKLPRGSRLPSLLELVAEQD